MKLDHRLELGGRAAEVGLDHARVAADDFGRPVRDHLAELEHDHVVGDPEHEPHVVIDQEHRRARVDDLAQVPPELLALPRVEAGGRLVEAEEPRLRCERASDPDELALALGEVLRHRVGHALEPEELEGRRPPPSCF